MTEEAKGAEIESAVAAAGICFDRRVAFVLAAMVTLGILATLSPPPGLNAQGFRALLALALALVFWTTDVLPPAVTAGLAIVVLPLLGVISFEKAVEGYADTSVALLVGVFVLASAMHQAQLDRRLALTILRVARADLRRTILGVIGAMIALTFIVPTAAGRAGLLLPIGIDISRATGLKQGDNAGKALFLAVSFSALVFSNALMTGAISMVYATSLFAKTIGHSWDYLSWATLMVPAAFLTAILLWPLLLLVFPFRAPKYGQALENLVWPLEDLGPLTGAEKKMVLVFLGLLVAWLSAPWHQLPTAMVALIAALATFFPGIEVHSWKQAVARIDWSIIVLLGGSLALARGLNDTGAMKWAANLAFGHIGAWPPVLVALSVLLICAVLRLGFTSVLAAMTIILPMVLLAAPTLGLNPLWLGMIAVVGGDLCLFIPTQSPTLLTTYASGYYSVWDTLRAGIPAMALLITVTLIMATFYWPALGFSPTMPAR